MLMLRLASCAISHVPRTARGFSAAAAAPVRLTEEERHKHLARLVGWTMVPGREAITRDFLFDDFKAAFSYMTEVALEAEKSDHHP
jgi:pterin-4a-carbinolamine dehydratase